MKGLSFPATDASVSDQMLMAIATARSPTPHHRTHVFHVLKVRHLLGFSAAPSLSPYGDRWAATNDEKHRILLTELLSDTDRCCSQADNHGC